MTDSLTSQSRAGILASIRRSLRRNGPLDPGIAVSLERRIEQSRPNVQPEVSADLKSLFREKLEAVHGSIDVVSDPGNALASILDYLDQNLEVTSSPAYPVAVGSTPLLESLQWPDERTPHHGAASREDLASVTEAYAGIAETGTLVMLSGPESPTTQNFLPDNHLVVLRESGLVSLQEEVWARLRDEFRDPPRTINLISGPSKTADVEQTIVYGAHGPRRLHVVLVEGA